MSVFHFIIIIVNLIIASSLLCVWVVLPFSICLYSPLFDSVCVCRNNSKFDEYESMALYYFWTARRIIAAIDLIPSLHIPISTWIFWMYRDFYLAIDNIKVHVWFCFCCHRYCCSFIVRNWNSFTNQLDILIC